jgi:RNA polymerase sigma-70 factor, ECF subfamily
LCPRAVSTGMTMDLHSSDEQELLRAAKEGDEESFRALVEGRRAELHAHCYRMLASPDDADDAVQEALVRAWKALPRFEGRSSIRTWLYKITTNTALDIASGRSRRELPIGFGPSAGFGEMPGDPITEIAWMGPYPDRDFDSPDLPESRYAARETIELAYVAALQHLPAPQRAVFILREVLGFRAVETAELLDTSVAAVNSSLQRARVQLSGRLPEVSQASEMLAMGDRAIRELASQYARAIEESDIELLLSLLTEDASWSMPPLVSWFRGRGDVAEFLRTDVLPMRWRHAATSANGQLAVAGYLFDAEANCFVSAALDVLELRAGRVAGVTGFLTIAGLSEDGRGNYQAGWGLFERFGLPERLAV